MLLKLLSKLFEPKPQNEIYLSEKDGHRVYFMEFGNPTGKVVINFHGGPGSYSKNRVAGIFDLKKYRVILFDQRGCGKSLPYGEIKNNTAEDAIDDAKRILDFLKVKDKIVIHGGSYGSALALLFAEKYPLLVEKIIISKVFLGGDRDIDWEVKHSAMFYPDLADALRTEAGGVLDTREYYAKLINSDDKEKQLKAINLFGSYEYALGSLEPKLGSMVEVDEKILGSMRIFINYTAKDFTIKRNQVMENISKIKDIETLIVHNRLDMVTPVENAYELHKALPKSKLVIAPYTGHFSYELYKVITKEIRKFL